ncbi:hypothetical protein JD292_02050 [Leucobacter sp. CSA2]|uniref:Uncharacterized protein n=1 Tax=Leucobacter edaphi TaxID=2796472 RepID=A0A934QD42_9MICO|nr:hypothetical protein [Leucobacter edaphi]MBK0420862.1 hypothetical protein [Leucobacter edaphi]
MTEAPKKKVVRVEASEPARTSTRGTAAPGGAEAPAGPVWTPTPEAKAKANRLRLISWAAWIVAIAVEAFAIFWVLKQVPVNMVLLIILIVVTGILSVGGSLCWKQANRLDPASEADKVRFFVQNQLGAIVAVVAFLPLIILIFMDKNMSGKQKALAGGIGIVVLIISGLFGTTFESPSQEQYAQETNIVQELTGKDEVFWVKGGSVFHVCEQVPDVNKESKDGQIYQGTVAAAHEAGKDRLTKRWQSEATQYCGYTQEQVDAVEKSVAGEAPIGTKIPASEGPSTDAPATDAPAPTEPATEEPATTPAS